MKIILMFVLASFQINVGLSLCPVYWDKTADWIWMPFEMVCRLGPRMKQVDSGRNPVTACRYRGWLYILDDPNLKLLSWLRLRYNGLLIE